VIGGISLVVLAIALFAVYSKKLAAAACGVCRDGGDRAVLQRAGADCAVVYEDSRATRDGADGEEAVVKITQVGALWLCIVLGVVAGKKFKTAAQ